MLNILKKSIPLVLSLLLIIMLLPSHVFAAEFHFPFEPTVSDTSGYFVLADSHDNVAMYYYQYIPLIESDVIGDFAEIISLEISENDCLIKFRDGVDTIVGNFSLYRYEPDGNFLLVCYRNRIALETLVGNYLDYTISMPYFITGLAINGSHIAIDNSGLTFFEGISLSFGSEDPYPELLYLYYKEIQGDLYDTFYPIVTGWLESIGGNTSNMQSYLQEITLLFTNHFTQSTLHNGDLTLLGYTESIDASLKEILEVFESSVGSGSESTDGLLQSILTFLSGSDLRTAINNGIGSFFSNPQGQLLISSIISSGVTAGVNNSDIPALLTELTEIVSELNAEYEYWSSGMNDYRYSEVNNRGKSVFQTLWYSLISPLISSDTSGSFSYYYVDEYGDFQTGHFSVIRLFQELIFSDDDDGSLDFNYFNNWDLGYLP